jgi:hypothetical protein
MQGTKIRLLTGGLLMMAAASYVQADALQPDPAWQQGTLANGFQWQVLATPQRPSDRIEIRLSVNTGSLTESTQQTGFSHFIPGWRSPKAAACKRFRCVRCGNRPSTRSARCLRLWSRMTTPCLT